MITFTLLASALAANPPGIIALDHIEHFTLTQPAKYWWNADPSHFSKGTLFVVEVDPDWALTRQMGGHVLYVGNTPAARLNPGHHDGHIIAYAPGHIDFLTVPVYWGPSTLPERVHPENEGVKARAEFGGLPFLEADVLDAHRQASMLEDHLALELKAAALIILHAPKDSDFARRSENIDKP